MTNDTRYRTHVRLDDIKASPTNPREHFNAADLAELAASIKAHGLVSPVLLRTNPDPTEGAEIYELISGERRWRAARIAGLASIPATIRDDLSPAAIIEIQLVENLQREDLHPLEEAKGYDCMMREHGYTADTLAEKIGKSRSYIFGRTKLLDLSEDARRLFLAGALNPSVALLVARIPTHKLQAKAIDDVMQTDYNGDAKSVRAASRWIRDRYMLRLHEAPFPIDDGELIALAGPCGPCPKRTGNAPEIFDDVESADVCTDPDCFALKKMAAAERRIQAAGKDIQVITGDEAEKIMPSWSSESKTHVKLDNKCYDDPEHRTYREIMAEDTRGVAMIAHGHKGDLVEVVSKKAVADKLKAAGVVTRKEAEKEDSKKTQAKVDLANHWRDKLFREVRKVAAADVGELGLSALMLEAMPIIALRFFTEIGFDRGGKVAGLWGAVGSDNYSRFDAFKFGLPNMTLEEQFLFCLDLALIAEHRTDQYNVDKQPGNLIALARTLAIDPDALLIDSKNEIKAAEIAKKPKKTSKKARPATSEDASTPTEAAQARDLLRAESEGGATEAAPAAGSMPLETLTANPLSSASDEANETPSEGVPGFAKGDTVLVLNTPSPDHGLRHTAAGKAGVIEEIYTDGRSLPIVVMIEGDELLFDAAQLQRIAWLEEKAIETDEKPPKPKRPAPLYVHPDDPELCWSGRGKKPKWVENWLAAGNTLDDLKTEGAAA